MDPTGILFRYLLVLCLISHSCRFVWAAELFLWSSHVPASIYKCIYMCIIVYVPIGVCIVAVFCGCFVFWLWVSVYCVNVYVCWETERVLVSLYIFGFLLFVHVMCFFSRYIFSSAVFVLVYGDKTINWFHNVWCLISFSQLTLRQV